MRSYNQFPLLIVCQKKLKVGCYMTERAAFAAAGCHSGRMRLRKRGFRIAPLQTDWVAEKFKLSEDELSSDFRLLLANGEKVAGAEVYRYLMRRIWWAMPFYFLSTLPVLRGLFDAAYRGFADNRYWISRTCHMPARRDSK